MTRHLIVVDCETNGLDPARHVAFEVAWWNLTTDQRGHFIAPHSPNELLATADLQALRVNRYIDRIPYQSQDADGSELGRLYGQLYDDATGTEHTLAGANPAFDAAFLSKLLDPHQDWAALTPWHHRLWDLSAYAAGVLGLDELPGLRQVCDLLDVAPPDHTAEGDVTATGLCFRALQARVKASGS